MVEDDSLHLRLVTLMLQSYGYHALAASMPAEALRLAKENPGEIHLLLTDLILPDMNGRDLAEAITELRTDIKCLFMSGYTGNIIARHGVLDEGVHFIQKPFLKEALAAKVREVLDGAKEVPR